MFKAISRPLQFLDGIADRLSAALGAVALSQFPQFFGQYIQRLGGHRDEAKLALDRYYRAAQELDMTLEEYIQEHLTSASEVFISSGRVIQELLERYQSLQQAYQALQEANIYNRWVVFLREVDWAIAAGTWDDFMPGVPTTVEGLTYALGGLLIGWGLYSLLKLVVTSPFRLLKRSKAAHTVQKAGKH